MSRKEVFLMEERGTTRSSLSIGPVVSMHWRRGYWQGLGLKAVCFHLRARIQDEDSLCNKLCTFTITQKEFMNQHW